MSKKEEKESKGKGSGVVVSIVIIAAIVLIILGFSLLSNKNAGQKNETSDNDGGSLQDEASQDEIGATEISEPTEYIVEIKLEGFVPKTLKIKKGDKVTWTNKIVTKIRPAGNLHPTHTNYPGSSIIKCGTAEEKNIFDACRELQNGESYSFVFNEVGSWSYHDHLQPSKDGKIIVEE